MNDDDDDEDLPKFGHFDCGVYSSKYNGLSADFLFASMYFRSKLIVIMLIRSSFTGES